MKNDSSTESWNGLGSEWFELAQTAESRMCFIMPYTLKKLGDVSNKKILDLGCGEGGYARELAKKNANVTAVDCAEKAVNYSIEQAEKCGLSIRHFVRNSNDLQGIENDTFDIVLCSMMLMDCEDFEGTVREVVRVLKPSGKLFASVLHPCFDGNHENGIERKGERSNRQVIIKNYFEPKVWEAPLNRGKTPVIWRHRTFEEYVKTFISCGLTITDLNEPRATDQQAEKSNAMAFLHKIPLYLFWELRK